VELKKPATSAWPGASGRAGTHVVSAAPAAAANAATSHPEQPILYKPGVT
jgi:hypothetical protein